MLNIIKNLFTKPSTTATTVRPVLTIDQVQFRRTTNRHGKLGTFSTNKGFMSVGRDIRTGRLASLGAK